MTPQEIAEARRAGAEGSAGRRGVVCARAADGRAAEVGAADGGAAGLMSGHEQVAVLRQWSGGRLLAEARAVFRAQSAGSGSESGAEARTGHGGEYLLLVVHRPSAVCGHVRWIVSRYEQRVDVAAGDRQAEVVADESHGTVGVGARKLAQAADRLTRLLRIPARIRDPHVSANELRAVARVLVCLQRDVDAEVRPADVGGQDARVGRARETAVVKRDGDRAV